MKRSAQLEHWLLDLRLMVADSFEAISSDAGFRNYFRFNALDGEQMIAVDAPTETENNTAFIAIAKAYQAAGVNAPIVYASDLERGFMCVTDGGDCLLSDVITAENMSAYYGKCLQTLIALQGVAEVEGYILPAFDNQLLAREYALFTDWLLTQYLALDITPQQEQMISTAFSQLTDNFHQQPQVSVHRDYHSRNIMLDDKHQPFIIDFQDSVIGPITYDAVSLLRDCYVRWPAQQVLAVLKQWHQQYYSQYPWPVFKQWFDLTGIQRHVKAAGIFSRLALRDGKTGYLDDIPNTLQYIIDIAGQYPELSAFAEFVESDVLPAVIAKVETRDD